MDGLLTDQFLFNLTTIFLLATASFCLTMVLTPVYTYFAYKYKVWKVPRKDKGEHKPVRNIPMMAGIVFVTVSTVISLLFNLEHTQTWLAIAALLGGSMVGVIDDIVNVRGLASSKARSALKFGLVALFGLALAWYFFNVLGYSSVHVPFVGEWEIGMWMVPLFACIVVAMGSAVNVTDGIDGLAGGLGAMALGVFGVIALSQGNIGVASFCFTIVGCLLAYTWFNVNPARFYMSNVGSFALGASLGVVAMLTNTLFLLPVVGMVFVAEAGTSLIQIMSQKLFGRKAFLAAPIHHHFEAAGWPQTKVTMRFWLLGSACAGLGLMLALTGGFVNW